MELAEVLKALFDQYGPAALPWSVVAFLGWIVLSDRKNKGTIPHEYQIIIGQQREALVDVTRAVERLAVLIEERTRRQANK